MENGNKNNGKAIASLVLGIASIVLTFFVWWLGIICGIVGIVLGAKARKETPSGLATGGFVCSIVGLVLSCVTLVCALCALGTLASLAAASA